MTIGVSSGGGRGHGDQRVPRRVDQVGDGLLAVIDQGDDRAPAGLGLLQIARHLLEDLSVRQQCDDRHLLVDERDRAVFHLSGRVALGMDVGDLLQLQRAFERNRVVDAATQVEEVPMHVEPSRDRLDRRVTLEHLFEQPRQVVQILEMPERRLRRQRPASLGQIERQQVQRHEL